MRTLFLVLLLALAGCSGGFDPSSGSASDGSGGHPFQDARGAGGSGGTGGSGSGASSADGGSTASSVSGGGGSGTGSGSGGAGGGGCGDTAHDPQNCGSCGRSCLGAVCAEALCASTQIVSAIATSLAVSSQAVVWGTSNGAAASDLDGTSPRQVALGVSGLVPAVAGNVDATAFIVGTSVLVFDAGATSITHNQAATSPVVLAADPGHVYWADGDGHAGLYQLDTASWTATQIAFPTLTPIALSVGDGLACWTAFQAATDGTVRCTPKGQAGAGAGAVLKSGLSSPCNVAVSLGEVFWAECPSGQPAAVSEASDQDGSGNVALSGMATAAVATDATYAYWADHGVFRRINIASGVIEPRGVAPSKINHLVAGPDRLYWSSAAGVHWVAK